MVPAAGSQLRRAAGGAQGTQAGVGGWIVVAVDGNRGPNLRSCSPSAAALGLGAGGRGARAPSRLFERGTEDAAEADTEPRSRRNDAAVGRVCGAASKKGSEAGSGQRAACSGGTAKAERTRPNYGG